MTWLPANRIRVDVVHSAEPVLVRVSGEVDLRGAPMLRDALAPLATRHIELDLSEVTFLDSSGLNEILSHYQHCRHSGGHLRLTHMSAPVARIMEITGIRSLLAAQPAPDHPR